MGNLKCGITQKRLIVEQNGRKFGTRGSAVHKCRVPLRSDSLCLVWGHSVHFANFPIPRVSKHYSFNIFHQILTKLHTKYPNLGLMQAITFFWQSAKNEKKIGTLKFFSTQDRMGLEISKRFSSYSFYLMSAKLYEDISYHGGIQTVAFVWQSAKF